MMIEAAAALASHSANPVAESLETHSAAAYGGAKATATGAFGQMVSQGLDSVNQSLLASETDLQQLATGNIQNLHQIMIRMEESHLSFQLFLQVRNRLLEAYQDVMKMTV